MLRLRTGEGVQAEPAIVKLKRRLRRILQRLVQLRDQFRQHLLMDPHAAAMGVRRQGVQF
jgi:hypothetical protein